MPKHRPPPSVAYALAHKFINGEHGSVRKIAEYAQRDLGQDGPTRESVYPVLPKVLREHALLTPPVKVTLPQQLAETFCLDPQRHHIQVIDVVGDKDQVGHAIAIQAAVLLKEPLEGWADRGHPLRIGFGPGELTRAVAKCLHPLLDAMPTPPDFQLVPLSETHGSGDLRLEDHPITFAGFLETNRNAVRFVEHPAGPTELAFLQSDHMAPAATQWTVVVARPGDRASLRACLRRDIGLGRLTVVTDVATATALVPATGA